MLVVPSLLEKSDNPSCGGADALTLLRLHYRPLRVCSVGASRHCIRRARNLNRRIFAKRLFCL